MNNNMIVYNVENGIAKVTLNSPKNLNAIDMKMLEELHNIFEVCDKDENVKVVILNGEGKGFSGGGDIGYFYKMLKTQTPDLEKPTRDLVMLVDRILRLSKPVIAMTHGPVAGAGFNLALACDFIISANDATFIQAFVKLGLIPDAGGLYLLTRAVGVNKATELAMLGQPINGLMGREMGFVYKSVNSEELLSTTMKFAAKLSAGPSLAYKNMKKLIYKSQYTGFVDYSKLEVASQVECTLSDDFKEGVFAFVEKRPANFTGK